MKHGVNLTHYIYMPFYNNKGRFHDKVPIPDWLFSLPESDLERIGMSYMLVCLEKLLFEGSYFKSWDVLIPSCVRPTSAQSSANSGCATCVGVLKASEFGAKRWENAHDQGVCHPSARQFATPTFQP